MNDKLVKLIAEADAVTENVKHSFGNLSAEQLNWKSAAESWSIGQCLDHLIVTNEREFPAIENALRENYKNPFWSKLPYLPKFFGNLMVNLFKPENTRKYKAPKSFRPSQSEVSANIVEDFAAHQQKVARFFEQSGKLDIDKTKIISPVTAFVTYSLFDSYRVLVVHEQRHFRQAERVLQTKGFPN